MHPLFTLMSESELLAQGLEQKHMGIFSQSVLDEIKVVQQIVGRPILDEKTFNSTPKSEDDSSPPDLTMISTTGTPNQITVDPIDDENLDMQIIHAGRNQYLDEFIQVLQLLLKESRESIKP